MSEVAQSLSTLSQLVLVRLLDTSKSRPGPKQVQTDLGKIVGGQLSSGEWKTLLDCTIENLEAAGFLTVRPYRLTELGRQEAVQYLGLPESELPQRLTWGTLKNKYLIPKALGLSVQQKSDREKVAQSEELKGAVLANHFNLPTHPVPTNTAAIHALAWRELGVETDQKFTIENVLWHLLSKHFSGGKKLDLKSLKSQLPVVVSGARNSKPDAIREAVLKKLLQDADLSLPAETTSADIKSQDTQASPATPEPLAEPESPISFDLEGFANTVITVARRCNAGEFGPDKVFISRVWRNFRSESFARSMTETDFKTRLLEAHRAGHLQLADAEFRQNLEMSDIRESKIVSGDHEYLFVSVK